MRNKNGQAEVGTMIALLILAVVGISVFIATTSDVVGDATGTTTVTNETRTATNNTAVTLANANGNDIVSGSETITNTTGSVTLTRNSNYTINYDTGVVTWTNVNNTGATGSGAGAFGANALVSYQYRDEAYVSSGSTRSLLNVLPILAGVAILLAVVTLTFGRVG